MGPVGGVIAEDGSVLADVVEDEGSLPGEDAPGEVAPFDSGADDVPGVGASAVVDGDPEDADDADDAEGSACRDPTCAQMAPPIRPTTAAIDTVIAATVPVRIGRLRSRLSGSTCPP